MIYEPKTGHLVFFEQAPETIGKLIALMDWPAPKGTLRVSHCGIVQVDAAGVAWVIENVWDDPPARYHDDGTPWGDPSTVGSVRRYKLAERCASHDGHPKRRLLVVERTDPGGFVMHAGYQLMGHSAYSISLLLLAGVASVYRRLPCDPPNPYWQTVHLHAHIIMDRLRYGDFVGTCAGTLAEIEHRAGLDLGIVEPKCADRETGSAMAGHVVEVVEALAAVAWQAAHRVGDRLVAGIHDFMSHPLGDFESIHDLLAVGRDGLHHEATHRFGREAAVDLLRRLHQFNMLKPETEEKLLHDLLVSFGVIDELVQPPEDVPFPVPPGPEEPVYLPLMSLGLMLDQLQLAGPYDPYAGP